MAHNHQTKTMTMGLPLACILFVSWFRMASSSYHYYWYYSPPCAEGALLEPICCTKCLPLNETLLLPRCSSAADGDLCEADGECGTDPALDNCGIFDVYQRLDSGPTNTTASATCEETLCPLSSANTTCGELMAYFESKGIYESSRDKPVKWTSCESLFAITKLFVGVAINQWT